MKWDPVDQTVLAEEQVDESGCSWRSGAKVENKLLKQWFIRTTRFAKDLHEGLNDSVLQDWRDIIKIQRHWLGNCSGVSFDFNLENSQNNSFITLWTDLPEHIENVKFIAVSEGHILAKNARVENTTQLPIFAINPFNQERIPVFATKEIVFVEDADSHVGVYHTHRKHTFYQ